MGFHSVSEQDQSKVRYAVRDAGQVLDCARRLSGQLKALFDKPHPTEHWGVSFVELENGESAEIQTPFGMARASTSIHINQDGVYGRYLIEKQTKNADGELVWRSAWVIRISRDWVVYPGEEGGEPVDVRDYFPGASNNDVARLGLSLLYSIGAN